MSFVAKVKDEFDVFSATKHGAICMPVFTGLLLILFSWTACWSLFGDECLPESNLFGILFTCICGKLLGTLLGFIRIPPLIGMIAAGILFRNLPEKAKLGADIHTGWSSTLRTGAFVILLLRAGLGLKLNILRKNKILVTCLSVLPCVIEVIVVGTIARLLLKLPWNWSILLGFVIAGVSPAVVIPSMLSLVARGYGERVGVPTLVMASATADNAFTITGFSVALTFVFPEDSSLAMVILKGPLELIIGISCGILFGYLLSFIPPKASASRVVIQCVLLCLVGLSAVFGLKRFTYSGAGVLAALVMSTVAAQTWESKNEISAYLQCLWLFGETLLFTLVGAQVDLSQLNGSIVGYGMVCLIIGILFRCAVAYGSVAFSKLNFKEKLFVCASWTPKATVQAAIGSIAYDTVMEADIPDEDEKKYGITVLCIAVLAIIVTSPPGAALITMLGPKLLDHKEDETKPLKNELTIDKEEKQENNAV